MNTLIITLMVEMRIVTKRAILLNFSNRSCLFGFCTSPLTKTSKMYARPIWARIDRQTSRSDATQIPSCCFCTINVRNCIALLAGREKKRRPPWNSAREISSRHLLISANSRNPWPKKTKRKIFSCVSSFYYRLSFSLRIGCNCTNSLSKDNGKVNQNDCRNDSHYICLVCHGFQHSDKSLLIFHSIFAFRQQIRLLIDASGWCRRRG